MGACDLSAEYPIQLTIYNRLHPEQCDDYSAAFAMHLELVTNKWRAGQDLGTSATLAKVCTLAKY